MIIKLALLAQLSGAPIKTTADISIIGERPPTSMAIPHISTRVDSAPLSILYTPVVMCDAIALTKQLPVEILSHCAVNRVGWLKL